MKLAFFQFERNAAFGILLSALVIMGLFLVADAWPYISRAAVFDEVQLGMTRDTVNQILIKHRMSCVGNMQTRYKNCLFEDLWRRYEVTFDQGDRVNYKMYVFNEPVPIEKRFLNASR